jgi:hypothetical protein
MKILNNKKLHLLFFCLLWTLQQMTAQCDFIDKTNGRRYIGECKTEVINGTIIRIPDGEGKQINPDGSYFVGKFSNGQRVKGQYFWTKENYIDEAIYENDHLKSGIYHFSNGAKYKGTFKNDEFDGNGIYYYESGRNEVQYEGAFKNGMYNGSGALTYKEDSKTQNGQWKDDEFLGKQIGTLYGQPVYWDMLNKITTSKETFDIKTQKLYSLEPTINSTHNKVESTQKKYFYIKDGNFILAVIEVKELKITNYGGTYGRTNLEGVKTSTQIDVSINKDATLLSHLNRNQYNKPAKLPLIHLKDRWYYDDNKCLWYLFNKSSSIYHNPSGQYKNIKLVRLDANKRESHETILNVSADLAKQIENDKLPAIITGTMVKTGEYQQTFNFYHCKDFSWPRDYFKDLFSNIGDYIERHKKFDMDLHNDGWMYYAEFQQNIFDSPTEEEKRIVNAVTDKNIIGYYEQTPVYMFNDSIIVNEKVYLLPLQPYQKNNNNTLTRYFIIYEGKNVKFAKPQEKPYENVKSFVGWVNCENNKYTFVQYNNGKVPGLNYFGSIYIGDNNPLNPNETPNFDIPAQDEIDEAAKQHDKCYDALNVKGKWGVVSPISKGCDDELSISCFSTIISNYNTEMLNNPTKFVQVVNLLGLSKETIDTAWKKIIRGDNLFFDIEALRERALLTGFAFAGITNTKAILDAVNNVMADYGEREIKKYDLFQEKSKQKKLTGNQKITYNERTLITKKSNGREVYAEQGDYFEGEFNNGKMVQGILYDENGKEKERIIIGRSR